MILVFSNKKTGHTICGKIIEYLSSKKKITLEEDGLYYSFNQGIRYPNNSLDYFFVEEFNKNMKKINLTLQFCLGAYPDKIDGKGNIRACIKDFIEFSDEGIITCKNKEGKIIWIIREDVHVDKIPEGTGGLHFTS